SDAFRILMYSTKEYDKLSFDTKLQDLKEPDRFEINYSHTRLTKDTVRMAKSYQAICIFINDECNHEILKKLNEYGVKLVVLRSCDFNNVDWKTAEEMDIKIGLVPGYSPNAVAEHAAMLVMALNRKIHRAYTRVKQGDFRIDGLVGFDMKDKTVGVLGKLEREMTVERMGIIGQFAISIFRGFGCKVLAYDDQTTKSEEQEELDFEYKELEEIYAKADIISIHLPLNDRTKHIINKSSIDKMKKGVLLVNTAKGGLIDTQALIDGLKQEKIGGVGLDVYENERKYYFKDYSSRIIEDDLFAQLLTYHNVIITAHQAFLTQETLCNIAKVTLENIHSFTINGKAVYAPKHDETSK
ncbi:unnamed protein product, partial [Didymodactylos carnosus]